MEMSNLLQIRKDPCKQIPFRYLLMINIIEHLHGRTSHLVQNLKCLICRRQIIVRTIHPSVGGLQNDHEAFFLQHRRRLFQSCRNRCVLHASRLSRIIAGKHRNPVPAQPFSQRHSRLQALQKPSPLPLIRQGDQFTVKIHKLQAKSFLQLCHLSHIPVLRTPELKPPKTAFTDLAQRIPKLCAFIKRINAWAYLHPLPPFYHHLISSVTCSRTSIKRFSVTTLGLGRGFAIICLIVVGLLVRIRISSLM